MMPANDPHAFVDDGEDYDDEDLTQLALIQMPVPRTRSQTVLPAMIEEAYNASVNRRPKASRKDYALGFAAGYQKALDEAAALDAEMRELLIKKLQAP
jgi:hypothetical protein